jgi:hypothetical protein
MKKSFAYRTIIVGLILSLTTNPVWAAIMVTLTTPSSPSTRQLSAPVNGVGKVMVMGDHIDNYHWWFGFGTKDSMGLYTSDLEEKIINHSATNWNKDLAAPPWNVSPSIPGMPGMRMPDHFARVMLRPLNGGTELFFENGQHTVTP